MCSAQLCCDTLGMKVEGTHNVFWLAKCTGWSLVSTPEAPVLEMYVVSCGRAVSVSVDSVSNRTGAWQLQWLDDSLVGSAQDGAPEFDGCDAAGTPWSELKGGSEWGELVSPLDMELQYQQRGMPAVGVARGVGVGQDKGSLVPQCPGHHSVRCSGWNRGWQSSHHPRSVHQSGRVEQHRRRGSSRRERETTRLSGRQRAAQAEAAAAAATATAVVRTFGAAAAAAAAEVK